MGQEHSSDGNDAGWHTLLPGACYDHIDDGELCMAVAGPGDGAGSLIAYAVDTTTEDSTTAAVPPFVWSVMLGRTQSILTIADSITGSAADNATPGPPSRSRLAALSKRALDIAIAVTSLVLLSPLMLVVAAAIRLSMGAPVFYGHSRVGENGQVFACLKFRTMVNDAAAVLNRHLASCPTSADEWRQTRKLRRDPRVTALGNLLRRSSIDELPQLINVLKGDMSCVGPRPVVKEELAPYGAYLNEYLSVRPGLTGIWQISGRNTLSYASRVRLDALYVRRWSMKLDLVILMRTIPALLRFEDTA
ncbi:exopolysaccharide production protein ExoY [Hyphomicrobium sp. 1Nfss2.1]